MYLDAPAGSNRPTAMDQTSDQFFDTRFGRIIIPVAIVGFMVVMLLMHFGGFGLIQKSAEILRFFQS